MPTKKSPTTASTPVKAKPRKRVASAYCSQCSNPTIRPTDCHRATLCPDCLFNWESSAPGCTSPATRKAVLAGRIAYNAKYGTRRTVSS